MKQDFANRVTAIFGSHDQKTIDQLTEVAQRAEQAALMADGHVGYVMPIGGVAAYDNRASVVGVGFDIACGNAAVRTNLQVDRFDRAELDRLADEIQRSISFGIGRRNESAHAPREHDLFAASEWDA